MPLHLERCAPVLPRLSDAEVGALSADVSRWEVVDQQLRRRFAFPDFARTMRFVNAVAQLAEAQDHHPQLIVEYGSCEVRFWTHSVGGLSRNDFICAAGVDVLPEAA